MVKNQRPKHQPNTKRRQTAMQQGRFSRMIKDADGEIDLSGLLRQFIDELQNLNNSVNQLRQVSKGTAPTTFESDDMIEDAAVVRRRPLRSKRQQRPVKRLQRGRKPVKLPKCVKCKGTMVELPDGTYSTAAHRSSSTISSETDLDDEEASSPGSKTASSNEEDEEEEEEEDESSDITRASSPQSSASSLAKPASKIDGTTAASKTKIGASNAKNSITAVPKQPSSPAQNDPRFRNDEGYAHMYEDCEIWEEENEDDEFNYREG